MKVSIIFRIQRWGSFILKGVGKKEKEHYLFTLGKPLTDLELFQGLAGANWQPNYMGYAYKSQIYQCRRLLRQGKHQYHLRFYDDGKVSGHFETSPEYDTSDHLSGVDLRTMNEDESQSLRNILTRGPHPPVQPGQRRQYCDTR